MKVTKKEILICAGVLGTVGSAVAGIYAWLSKESESHGSVIKNDYSKIEKTGKESLYDFEGFDENGFNKKGYDRNGYDLNGFDKNGFNSLGYNSEGFDKRGFDFDGYNKRGFNRLGFNRQGFNTKGYDKAGYNILGLDICGKSSKSYEEFISILEKEKEIAFSSLSNDQLDLALLKARTIMEDAITLLIKHYRGESSSYIKMKLEKKINILKQLNKDIDSDFIDRCHQVRKICNPGMHTVLESSVTHNQAHFAVMQAKETIQLLKQVIGGQAND